MKSVIFNRSCWVLCSQVPDLKKDFGELLARSQFTVLGCIEHEFSPLGYSIVWLLGESHFAIHTFPENHEFYIELSSCVKDKYDLFWGEFSKMSPTHFTKIYLMEENIHLPNSAT